MLTCVKSVWQSPPDKAGGFRELRNCYRALVRAIETGDMTLAKPSFFRIEGLQGEWFGLSEAGQAVFDELGVNIATEDVHGARQLLELFRTTLRAQVGQDRTPVRDAATDTQLEREVPDSGTPARSGIVPRPLVEEYAIEAACDELPPTASYRPYS